MSPCRLFSSSTGMLIPLLIFCLSGPDVFTKPKSTCRPLSQTSIFSPVVERICPMKWFMSVIGPWKKNGLYRQVLELLLQMGGHPFGEGLPHLVSNQLPAG